MSILKYNAFLKAIEYGSLTKAAEALVYTQPGISHMISSLEKEMGFPLLVRSKEGVFPTENAEPLIYYMQRIVSAEDTLKEISCKIRGIEIGSLKVGAFYSTSVKWVPPIVSRFSSLHPGVKLQVFEGNHFELEEWLTNGTIDIGLMSMPVPENYDFIPLYKDSIMAVLPTEHPLARCEKVDPAELVNYPFIIPHDGGDEDVWQVMNAENLTPEIKYRIKGDMATISMIGQNLGVSLIPGLALPFQFDNIVTRPLIRDHSRVLGLAIRSIKHASPAAEEFISITKEYLKTEEMLTAQQGLRPGQ